MITIPTHTGRADETYLRTLTDTLKQIQRLLSEMEALVTVYKEGVLKGTRKSINFIDTGATTVTVTDDADNDRINVTIGS